MFISRVKYEVEKSQAQQRIEQLEHLLCPEGHDYKKIGTEVVAVDHTTCSELRRDIVKCSKCGKIATL